jgi:pyrimidine-specific ribonucleoside hydrolase
MKRKAFIIFGIIFGVLFLCIILIWPMAPLWERLGAKPMCIQGSWPKIKLTPCAQTTNSGLAIPPSPIPTLSGQAPVPIIVDDDGSPDGTIALLYFLQNPLYDVRAVTISNGEAHPDLFVPLVIQLLAGLGKANIPVGAGRSTPLEGTNAFPDPWREASDGFWEVALPQTTSNNEPRQADELIMETLTNSTSPVMIFVSGSHTNLAEALRLEPSIGEHISGVYVMGGSIYVPGNIESDWPLLHNKVAEWNVWVDPIAAKEVFASGLPLHLIPLDATNQVTWTEADALSWVNSATPEGVYAADILRWMLRSWETNNAYIWDLVAATVTTDPRLCLEVPLALNVVVDPGPEQGRTVVGDGTVNAQVCLKPDTAQVKLNVAGILGQP